MKKQHIFIYGAGGHGIVVADIIRAMKAIGQEVEVRGFLDDDKDLWGKNFWKIPVLGSVEQLEEFPEDKIIVAVGDNTIRKKIIGSLDKYAKTHFTAIHPSAVISPSAVIGEGCMICANAVVNPESSIGDHVILNTSCTVDHHNRIGEFVHLAPGVHTGGEVEIGQGTFVGIGVAVLPGRKVGEGAMIGAGSVVTRDVKDHMVVCGNPARAIRRRDGA